ncbi:MAG: DUF2924 domain-containing protein [Phycisphaerales bacterium]|nr:DUF2924 domain-containing protein [Planctomycetota bacterium]MCH8507649.1 DUF2924 domain-containing protein [Phycisphaerales bacterium]
MTGSLASRIATLEHLTPAGLREVYAEVFGEPSRSNNKRWLIRRIAWRMQAQAEGGLSERARARAEELARDEDLRVRPPSDRGPGLGASLRTVTGTVVPRPPDARLPVAGTVLVRPHKGVDHRVTVLAEGFEHEGAVYRSLSAVAHAITGSHWNGYHFFGLTRPASEGRG